MKPWPQVALFTFLLGLGGAQRAAARDFADGLAGGPDFWRVTNLCLSPKPALHEAPSHHARRLTYLASGAIVKSHGCKIAHRERWCRVETTAEPVAEGWIIGNCLREAPAPH
jgi:hypothetical protein